VTLNANGSNRNDRGEPCTRQGALDAGWRFAGTNPGDALVLQHSGADGNRWLLRAASLELGLAVATFKERRDEVVHGAVALWHNGRVSRFEAGSDLHRTGTE
jgi:hypothetical protein